MSNISSLVEVFKMNEIPIDKRINLIIKLGQAINYEFATNISEPIVYELVSILNPNHEILNYPHYRDAK